MDCELIKQIEVSTDSLRGWFHGFTKADWALENLA